MSYRLGGRAPSVVVCHPGPDFSTALHRLSTAPELALLRRAVLAWKRRRAGLASRGPAARRALSKHRFRDV
jgi:hypothetical protein